MLFKKVLALSLASLTFAGIATAQEPTAEPVFTAEYENASFTYPIDLANGVDVTNVQEVTPEEAADPTDVTPAHTEFSFIGWQPEILLDSAMWNPVVRVYPVAGFAAFGEENANMYQIYADALAQLLAEKPEGDALETMLATLYDGKRVQPAALPFLYNAMAAQVLRAQVEYLEFEGGSGLRYLTFYAQAVNPVEEGWVFYTFQGLSEDGKYYIHATFPVVTNVPMLSELPDGETVMNDPEAYYAEVVAALDEQPAEAYTPSLETLDSILTSLVIAE